MGTGKSPVGPAESYVSTTASSYGDRDRPSAMPLDDGHRLEHQSSDDIRDDIDSTRNRMDETLDQLGERLSPRRLIDDVVQLFNGPSSRQTASRFSNSATEFGENFGRTVRDNPVPMLLIGAGLAWLAFGDSAEERALKAQRRRRQLRAEGELEALDDDGFGFDDEDSYYSDQFYGEDLRIHDDVNLDYPIHGTPTDKRSRSSSGTSATNMISGAAATAKKTTTDAASSVGETLKDAASATTSAVSGAATSVAEGVSNLGESIAEGAKSVARQGRSMGSAAYRSGRRSGRIANSGISRQRENAIGIYDELSERYWKASNEYPLAVGAGCLALGMLTGLLVPRTDQEDQWMGETSDKLRNEIKEAGENLVNQTKDAALATLSKAKQSADEHGLSGESLLERGERVVSKVAKAASDALEEEQLSPNKLRDDIADVGTQTGAKAEQEGEKLKDSVTTKAKSNKGPDSNF